VVGAGWKGGEMPDDASKRLVGKVAVVTGSTSGIGAAVAKAFAAEGAKVVVSGRREDRGEAVVEQIASAGGEAVFVRTDVSVPADCAAVCAAAAETFGGLDVLANSVGIFPRMPFEQTTPEFWDRMFAVNVRGPFLCCQAAVPLLRKRGGGSIINLGSTLPWAFSDNLFAYGSSKGALYTMTRQLAGLLRKDRIRSNWITVGWVITEKELEIWDQQGGREQLYGREKNLPMGQFNTLEDMAEACVYLASDAAARVTGTDLNVSAGMQIRM